MCLAQFSLTRCVYKKWKVTIVNACARVNPAEKVYVYSLCSFWGQSAKSPLARLFVAAFVKCPFRFQSVSRERSSGWRLLLLHELVSKKKKKIIIFSLCEKLKNSFFCLILKQFELSSTAIVEDD